MRVWIEQCERVFKKLCGVVVCMCGLHSVWCSAHGLTNTVSGWMGACVCADNM